MSIGTCRREGCDRPRRVRRGLVEPLCEDCYRAACRRVAAETARQRYRQINLHSHTPAPAPPRHTPREPAPPHDPGREAAPSRRPRGRPRLISDALLEEARRRHHEEHRALSQIAHELLDHTGYAKAANAEAALRRAFKGRGWALSRRRGGPSANRRTRS
ncbi:MAG: hypothetical protein MSC31_15195 [Solirubrobacteraceae bacterium MAG38_C4-C5]|nr:hypothetical protein [Candidatus Siliceabacter maunaloa]